METGGLSGEVETVGSSKDQQSKSHVLSKNSVSDSFNSRIATRLDSVCRVGQLGCRRERVGELTRTPRQHYPCVITVIKNMANTRTTIATNSL